MDTQASTTCALCTGSAPPRTQDKLISEWLPQIRQVSWGLSLITSQSAQKTAFCKQIALISLTSMNIASPYYLDAEKHLHNAVTLVLVGDVRKAADGATRRTVQRPPRSWQQSKVLDGGDQIGWLRLPGAYENANYSVRWKFR